MKRKKIFSIILASFLTMSVSNLISCGTNKDNQNKPNTDINNPENPSIPDDNGVKPNDNDQNSDKPDIENKPNESDKENNNDNDKPTIPDTKPDGEDIENEKVILPDINVMRLYTQKYNYCYVWSGNDSDKYFGIWPGQEMQKYNDKWNYIDLPQGVTSTNIVFNLDRGKEQSPDLLDIKGIGHHWYDWTSNAWSHSNIEGGDFQASGPVEPGIPEGGLEPQSPFEPVEAETYKDFQIFKDMKANPNDYKVVNKYSGKRHDFRDESIYFAMTTRFYDGDTTNNVFCWDSKSKETDDPEWRGDFKGLIQRLDYIKALGFTSIWITPVVENCSGFDYHGYHALNMSKVDPRYESSDCNFQDLINAAHAKDMKIILDVVFNHTGNFGETNLFPMFEKQGDLGSIECVKILKNSGLPDNYNSLTGDKQYGARIENMKNDSSDINRIYHHEKSINWEGFTCQTAQIAGDCVDLNTENPLVAEYLIKAFGNYIRMGVDYFRVDTMKHVSRLTLNNYIIPGLYEYAKLCGNNEFYMFGEVCTRVREVWNHGIPALSAPFYTWKENKNYQWGNTEVNEASTLENYNDNATLNNVPTSNNAKLDGLTYHEPDHRGHSGTSVIDFPMHWNFYETHEAYNLAINTDQFYNDATYNVVYVDSHDYSPDACQRVRFNGGTERWAKNMNLMFTFRGIPCIYYGSEIEFQKGKVIDDGPNTPLKETGRAYYGDHLEGTIKTTDFAKYEATGKISETLNSTLAKHLQDLNTIRNSVPALRKGQYTTSNVNANGGIAYIRRYTNNNVDSLALVAINSATFNNIPLGNYVDLISGTRKVVDSGSLRAEVNTNTGLAIYVLENSSTGTLNKLATRSPFFN